VFSNAPDSAARGFLYSSILWLVVGASALALASAKLVSADLLSTEVLSYGRVRAVASIALIYGWLTQAAIASMLYVVPRVTGSRISSEFGGQVAGMLVNAGLLVGVLVALLGGVSGSEFMELPVWLGAVLVLALLGLASDVVRTILRRTEPRLFVSLLYFTGAIIAAPISLVVGSIAPVEGVRGYMGQLFAVHSYLYVFLGGAAIGTALYLVPRGSGNPLYSNRLAVIGFWWLLISAPLTAQARAVFGPAPDSLETASIAASIALLVPIVALSVNVFGTLHGAWGSLSENPSLKFISGGTALFAGAVAMGLAGSFRSVAKVVGATDWVSGQVWTLVIALSLLAGGFVTFAFPRLIGKSWVARSQVTAHFWLSAAAAALVAVGAMAAGLAMGLTLHAGAALEAPLSAGGGFELVLSAARPYRGIVFAGAALFAVAQWMFAGNVIRSTARGDPRPVELVAPVEEF
jgi:cytochrome c oxidase cbb3-type subunit 1